MKVQQSFLYWSGGKDASMALYKSLNNPQINLQFLYTTIQQELRRISMHGVPEQLLLKQVAAIGLPLRLMELPASTTHNYYEQITAQQLQAYAKEGLEQAIFGDIFLEDLKEYRLKQLQPWGIQAHFPLWKQATKALLQEFIDLGFKAVVVAANARLLDRSFLGRILDHSFLEDLPANVDPCGENGEFHTFVYDGPIFNHPVVFELGEVVEHQYEAAAGSTHDTVFLFQELKSMQ